MAGGLVIAAGGGIVAPVLLVAYLMAKPFYLFPGGDAQIADLIACLLFVAVFIGRQTIRSDTAPVLWIASLFATYSLIVNAIWALLMMDISMLMTPAYYFFNTLMMYVVLTFGSRSERGMLKILLFGVVAAVALQAVLTIWSVDPDRERQVFFFNDNPNRPAYWALLSATIFLVIANRMKIGVLVQYGFMLMIFYLIALALSKAGLIAVFLLLVIHFSRSYKQLFVVLAVAAVALYFASQLPLMEHVIARLDNIGHQSDDSLHGRGYDRLWLHPQYLFFGAGEQGLSRFPETDIEFHSTLGTVLFSYGAVGVILFLSLIWQLFRSASWREFLYLGPVFAYGLAHQGLRFTLLWILFALLALGSARSAPQRSDESKRPADNVRPEIGGLHEGPLLPRNARE